MQSLTGHGTAPESRGCDHNDAIARLGSDGFVLWPECCDAALRAQFLEAARRRIREVMAALDGRSMGIGSAAGFVEICQRSPGRWDLPISPEAFGARDQDLPWWPLVQAVLGDDAEHSFSGVVYSEPGSPAQHWHIDSPHENTEHLPPHALNVLVALHDIPLDMGPTEMARGSHRLTNHLRNPSLARDELVYQHATTTPAGLVAASGDPAPDTWAESVQAGTCLVFDDRILHRGLANRSDRNRYVGYFSYRKSGYAENTHFESQRSVFDQAGFDRG